MLFRIGDRTPLTRERKHCQGGRVPWPWAGVVDHDTSLITIKVSRAAVSAFSMVVHSLSGGPRCPFAESTSPAAGCANRRIWDLGAAMQWRYASLTDGY